MDGHPAGDFSGALSRRKRTECVIYKIKTKLLASLAICGLVTAPIAATAQGTGNTLGIPDNFTMMGQNDPNVRTATAVVNGQVITGTDIDQRVALVLAANESALSAEELQRLRMQVLRNLIDETLQIQEARAQEIEIQQAEIDQTYARVAAQNFGQDTKKMDEYLISIGSSAASLKRQIHGELAWQRLLSRNIAPFVNVSEEEVNELLARLEASRGTDEYRLGEIYLSATPETREAVFENGKRIMAQLQQGGSFVAYARQFSEASTAAVGGDLGWVRLAQLPDQLSVVAREMQPGQLVGPIEIPGGFSILYLIDKRQVLMADPRDAVLSLKQISIAFPPGTTEEQAGERVQVFAKGVQSIRGCGDAERVAAAMDADIVTNDQIRVRALPEQLQGTLLQMQIGQTTPPFGSIEDGVRVLMLCGRDDPQSTAGPDFDTLMNQLEEERIQKRAQRYLRDLRNDAIIEYN
ncbi:MAG: peptidylprolyl isomerase [Sphingomonadaceae bacterium]